MDPRARNRFDPSADLERISGSLASEFSGIVSPADVERLVEDSFRMLVDVRPAGLTDREVDGFARHRLLALARVEGLILVDRPSVLFVCVHNAGRSQMSAGWARHFGGDRLLVFSGGSSPADRINPLAVEAMAEAGVDISDGFPKPFTDEIVRASEVVVTMGCGDACPYFPDKRYLDWELADPHRASLDEVRLVRDEIRRLVGRLLGELGLVVQSSAG